MIPLREACRDNWSSFHFVQNFHSRARTISMLCIALERTISGGNMVAHVDTAGFPGFWTTLKTFRDRLICVQWPHEDPKLAKWRPAAGTSLYRDPYYKGIWEIQCKFWWFSDSVGSHKRSQTLHAITSDNNYICNIKIKIKIFST